LAGFNAGEEPLFVQRVENEFLEEVSPPDEHVEAVVIGSVNPVVGSRFRVWAEQHIFCPIFEFRIDLPNPMPMKCQEPHRVGADRIANAIALHRRTGRGGVAVDFGTATSFAAVSPEGEFLGGAIAPGLNMCARALHEDTALLPYVVPDEAAEGPGLNTEDAMAVGLLWGLGGMVDRLVEHLSAPRDDAPAIATGGHAERLVPYCQRVDSIAPHLTLEGLRDVYLRRTQ
jgi:type III pantothenate kinase